MISRLTGQLAAVDGERIVLEAGPAGFEILVPASDSERYGQEIGRSITVYTLLIIDSQNQGASLTPRLLGFRSETDRAFFELFVTCKGIGHRKALRAMSLPAGLIAGAISGRDVATLQTLPEIGKRTAETIIASLSGKVDRFVEAGVVDPDQPSAEPIAIPAGPAEEAVEILIRLGETRPAAQELVQKALQMSPDADASDQILAAVYRVRSS